MKRFLLVFAFTFALAPTARADLAWVGGSAPGVHVPSQSEPLFTSFAVSGTDNTNGVSGSSFGEASIGDGTLRANVSATANPGYVGSSNATAGLSSVINLDGPADVGGTIAVTMNFDALWGGSGAPGAQVILQSGPGGDFRGFAGGNPALRGLFYLISSDLHGPSVLDCTNCSYALVGGLIEASVTTYLTFEAGAHSVQYAAQVYLDVGGSFIDGSHTARFSIDVPEGFTYSSALKFQDSPVPSIPEPATLPLLGLGLAAVCAITMRRRRSFLPG